MYVCLERGVHTMRFFPSFSQRCPAFNATVLRFLLKTNWPPLLSSVQQVLARRSQQGAGITSSSFFLFCFFGGGGGGKKHPTSACAVEIRGRGFGGIAGRKSYALFGLAVFGCDVTSGGEALPCCGAASFWFWLRLQVVLLLVLLFRAAAATTVRGCSGVIQARALLPPAWETCA